MPYSDMVPPTTDRPAAPRRPRIRKEAPEAAQTPTTLAQIVSAGLDALEAYAARCEQRRRDVATAPGARHWRQYYLLSDGLSVVSPEGEIYQAALDPLTGVVRYPCVPDQAFIDRLNMALRAAGSRLTLTTKHRWIAQRLKERADYPGYGEEILP